MYAQATSGNGMARPGKTGHVRQDLWPSCHFADAMGLLSTQRSFSMKTIRSTQSPKIQSRAQEILKVTLASLALSGCVAAMAQAQPQQPQVQPQVDKAAQAAFMKADVDKDGKLSRAEAGALSIAARFDELDADKDGSLSMAEYLVGAGRPQ
jgi:EF hand